MTPIKPQISQMNISEPPGSRSDHIRVKVLTPVPQRYFMHQLPGMQPTWGGCQFSFDPADRDYDWLVIYEDLPGLPDVPRNKRCELLACPPNHTLLTTTEPSSIKHYGNPYTKQFGCVITSQAAWALPHRDRVFSQAGLIWYYGVGHDQEIPFDAMLNQSPLEKSRDLSMVFSPKRQRHTLHHRRFNFMHQLMTSLPEMDVFGRGARPLDDKAEALNPYRYHVAIENYVGPHHWTEKLADAFLGLTLPFYCGCPNASDYFPAESYIPIDINDPEGAVRTIRRAIADNEYEKRLPAILEARRRVMYEHNFFALVSREIEKRHNPALKPDGVSAVCSRHAVRGRNLTNLAQDMFGKARARVIHWVGRD